MSVLDLLERAQNVLVAAASREVAGSQDTLLAARRDRKTLERLRRRRAADHLYRANREDGRELDDMFRVPREVR
jgi:flagellar biosynthesis chaperone FliJ